MPHHYSTAAKEELLSVSGEAPLLCLEITHGALSAPIRVVSDNQDLLSNGNTYTALAFRAMLPDDLEGQLPRAQLVVDNVGRELVQWLEASNGGEGARVKMMQIRRADPDVVEWEIDLDLTNVKMTAREVSGQLGFEDLLSRPAVAKMYNSTTAPGLY